MPQSKGRLLHVATVLSSPVYLFFVFLFYTDVGSLFWVTVALAATLHIAAVGSTPSLTTGILSLVVRGRLSREYSVGRCRCLAVDSQCCFEIDNGLFKPLTTVYLQL